MAPGERLLRLRRSVLGSLLCCLLAWVGGCQAPARQPEATGPRAQIELQALQPDSLQLARHDLAWIITATDFAQHGLSEHACEDRLSEILQAQRDRPVAAIEVPINLQRLQYHGRIVPSLAGVVPASDQVQPAARRFVEALDGWYHQWSYGEELSLLSRDDGRAAQLVVFALIRAWLILERLFPSVHMALFAAWDDEERARASDPDAPWLNLHSRTVFALNSYPRYTAVSSYLLGVPDASAEGPPVYHNLPVTMLNLTGMQGTGSSQVYGLNDADSFHLYLRDGLVETFVHEGLHNRIARSLGSDPFLQRLKALPPAVSVAAEEAFVTQSSLRFAREALAVSAAVLRFYQTMLQHTHLPALGIDVANRTVSAQGWQWLRSLEQRMDGARVWRPERVGGAALDGVLTGRPVELPEFFELGMLHW